jgi:hypothetical protein
MSLPLAKVRSIWLLPVMFIAGALVGAGVMYAHTSGMPGGHSSNGSSLQRHQASSPSMCSRNSGTLAPSG